MSQEWINFHVSVFSVKDEFASLYLSVPLCHSLFSHHALSLPLLPTPPSLLLVLFPFNLLQRDGTILKAVASCGLPVMNFQAVKI